MKTNGSTSSPYKYYYGHDQLYSPVILVNAAGSIEDRYEYDVYGACRVLNADYTGDADGRPDCGNPYLFTGREVDFLDGGSLALQYNRHRYYSQSLGRWMSEDPLGTDPAGRISWNLFGVSAQYDDGMSLYQCGRGNPMTILDAYGLWGADLHRARTFDAAVETGLAFAADVANWDDGVDAGLNSAPTAYGISIAISIGGLIANVATESPAGTVVADAANEAYLGRIAYWHFPGADLGQSVVPNSWAAHREVKDGIKECNLKQFSEGLHQLQDSYAHQSNGQLPPFGRNKIGHSRDRYGWNTERWNDPTVNAPIDGMGLLPRSLQNIILKKLRVIRVALSTDADSVQVFPSDAKGAIDSSKAAMQQFMSYCPCIKKGPHTGSSSKSNERGRRP